MHKHVKVKVISGIIDDDIDADFIILPFFGGNGGGGGLRIIKSPYIEVLPCLQG